MDIDYYLAREQVEQVMARAALTPASRDAHARRATSYRDLVAQHRAVPAKTLPVAIPGLHG